MIAATQSTSQSTDKSVAASPLACGVAENATVDNQLPMWWHLLTYAQRQERISQAHKAVDMLWFVHGLSFNLIGSPLFLAAVAKIKAAPGYEPCCRQTLATSHLAARHKDANAYKVRRLEHGQQYGFLVTSDGWRNKRRSYHNFILVAGNVPPEK